MRPKIDNHPAVNISSGEYRLAALKIASVDRAIARARSHARKGELAQAREHCQAVLAKFPKNKRR
ncbi:MAG: hypothetical protein O6909_11190, partial [Alphaproteobacteria bacterium]|nr:hypothetical protein [Alphaproteobacteria bacterium]